MQRHFIDLDGVRCTIRAYNLLRYETLNKALGVGGGTLHEIWLTILSNKNERMMCSPFRPSITDKCSAVLPATN